MFSGKTDMLLERVRLAEEQQEVAALAKPLVDTRAGPLIVSHSGAGRPALVVRSAQDLVAAVEGSALVAVDEVQFLRPEVAGVFDALRREGIRVIAAGLDLDFRARPFPTSLVVAATADRVIRLTAACGRCGGDATLTQRVRQNIPASPNEPVIAIGGADIYEPRCDDCYEVVPVSVRRRL